MKLTSNLLAAALGLLVAGGASAGTIYWTDWTGTDQDPGVGFTGQGAITT